MRHFSKHEDIDIHRGGGGKMNDTVGESARMILKSIPQTTSSFFPVNWTYLS